MTEFDPMQSTPVNDEQAEIALRHGQSAITAASLCGIYQCKRKLDLSVIDAYMAALQAYIDACEKRK